MIFFYASAPKSTSEVRLSSPNEDDNTHSLLLAMNHVPSSVTTAPKTTPGPKLPPTAAKKVPLSSLLYDPFVISSLQAGGGNGGNDVEDQVNCVAPLHADNGTHIAVSGKRFACVVPVFRPTPSVITRIVESPITLSYPLLFFGVMGSAIVGVHHYKYNYEDVDFFLIAKDMYSACVMRSWQSCRFLISRNNKALLFLVQNLLSTLSPLLVFFLPGLMLLRYGKSRYPYPITALPATFLRSGLSPEEFTSKFKEQGDKLGMIYEPFSLLVGSLQGGAKQNDGNVERDDDGGSAKRGNKKNDDSRTGNNSQDENQIFFLSNRPRNNFGGLGLGDKNGTVCYVSSVDLEEGSVNSLPCGFLNAKWGVVEQGMEQFAKVATLMGNRGFSWLLHRKDRPDTLLGTQDGIEEIVYGVMSDETECRVPVTGRPYKLEKDFAKIFVKGKTERTTVLVLDTNGERIKMYEQIRIGKEGKPDKEEKECERKKTN